MTILACDDDGKRSDIVRNQKLRHAAARLQLLGHFGQDADRRLARDRRLALARLHPERRIAAVADAFRKLHGRGLSMIPVVDAGRLVGIGTLQNLTHSMALLAESRRLKRAEQDTD